ncbi:RNA 2',3'-cyclic phosphodiesterase [Candidatus Micrarchaeota archaeon]|nr:RNA 2',3'-cyclic phosphodiesterase [Candidatus Micrarchaeota archaeon]
MKKRLFIAVLIPAVIQKKIQETIFPIVVPFKEELKIVARENLHFTVRFLGGWPEEKIPELVETLKPLSREKVFEIQLEKAGFFKNRVLWLGIQQGKIELQEKNQMIIQCLHVKPE